jgi:hypothetical protein
VSTRASSLRFTHPTLQSLLCERSTRRSPSLHLLHLLQWRDSFARLQRARMRRVWRVCVERRMSESAYEENACVVWGVGCGES